MAHGAGLIFDLIAKDGASPAFLKVAGAADKAAASTARAQKGVATSSAAMARTGAKLTKGLTLPLLAIGAVSVAQASKWQKSMTLIQTAGGETAAKTAALSSGLKKLAVETGTSLDALGEGIYTIAKAGAQKWSAVDQLKVMRAAAQGAKAENVSLGVATDALSTVMLDYHVSASKAVATENELVRASGLAKTNFGLFSESLSNVTPIAAALGVSFAEIGGAIATMTQHGVSAAQATENLRNLLFNLSGQNNVASQAMQQLGIDTVDLAKNLGRRGLTGTLAIVDKALADHTKRGMVVIDVHKAAALATRSLNEMLRATSGPLRDQSRGLLAGKVSIADYTKYAKSLGGRAGASALQFKALYLNSLGFSNQLRAGKGTITTTTAQYQKLLGGMTGASVAMQIGGKYAKENARNVREVGKAAKETSGDVLGWDKTQGTLAVKMDKAKASLQVMAVEIGSALIPAVSKIVGWVSKAVHWFSQLSGTQKSVLLWSGGVLLALGPILSLGSRLATVGRGLSTFAANAGTRIASMAGASEKTASRVGVAMRRVTSAVSGVLAGGIAAQIGGNSSGGWLTSIFLGTAGGWALGGPIGAAIGGVSAAIFKGIGLWGDHKKAAQDAARAEIALVHELTAAIEADNGMLGSNIRLNINKKLYDAGTYDLGKNLNGDSLMAGLRDSINPSAILDAALGKSDAGIQKFALSFGTKVRDSLHLSVKEFAKGYGNDFSKLIGDFAKADPKYLTGTQKKLQQVAKDYTKLYGALGPVTAETNKATQAWHDQFAALNDNRQIAGDFSRGLMEVRKNLVTSLNTNGDYIHSLRGSGDAAVHNRQVFKDLAAAARADAIGVAQAAAKHGTLSSALKAGNADLAHNRAAIIAAAQAAGFNKKQTDALLTSLHVLGKTDVKAKVKVDDGGARATVRNLRAWFNSLTWTAHIVADGSQVTAGPGTFRAVARAGGGSVFGPGTSTSDSIPAVLSNGEFVVNARQAKKHRALLENINKGVQGFSTGGSVGNAQQIASALSSAFHLSGNQIAGILGNLKIESNFNPRAYNARENAHGFAQWEGSRWTALQNYARSVGMSATSTRAQIGFLVKELRGSGLIPQIKRMSDPRHVAALVDARYERSSGSTRKAREDAAAAFARSGIATGVHVGKITTGRLDGKEVWIFQGKKYASLRAAQNARASAISKAEKAAKAEADKVPARLQSLIGAIGHTPSGPKFDINQLGYKTIAAQIATARKALATSGLSPEKAKKFRDQITHWAAVLQHQLGNLRVKIKGSDLKALGRAIGGTADDVRASFTSIITDLRHAGASKAQIGAVRRREAAVVAANNRYTAARDYRSTIRGTLAGTFDPTQYGSATDLIAGLSGQTSQNNAYASELAKLRGETKGNKTLTAFINQLAASGQTATLQSLAGASKGDLANVTKSLGAYNQSLNTGADAATQEKYGKTAAQLHGDVDRMVKHTDQVVTKMVHAISHLAGAIGKSHTHASEHTDRQIENAVRELEKLLR